VRASKGYATAKQSRTVLSGICGWLVRRGALSVNPVRDLTPLELDRDGAARALSVEEMRAWLALLDESDLTRRHDPPDLDVDLSARTIAVRGTIVRATGKGRWPNASSRGRRSAASCCRRGASNCSVLAAFACAALTDRSPPTPEAAGGTGAMSGQCSGQSGAARTPSGSRRIPTARRSPPCSIRAVQAHA
jgi:hypothetical protein